MSGQVEVFSRKKKVEKGSNVRFTGYLIQHKSKKSYDSRLSTSNWTLQFEGIVPPSLRGIGRMTPGWQRREIE